MKNQNKNQKFGIVREVIVEYYYEIEAKSIRGAKQKARNMVEKGFPNETGYNWVETNDRDIEVFTWEEFGKARSESIGERVFK